ncbi:adenine phosphoribosyltransferase [Elusimicrobium simillimum]|uniref:adenine phosphoribosyltransferase n=1 Tax=Elusimicrobium simillimum TaxID=3143438 RepID=UPI003C6F50F7
MDLKQYIKDVPNFPKEGVIFKDITPLLDDHAAFTEMVAQLIAPFKNAGITKVAGIDSRGFILAAPVALALGVGFVPVRKKGKLPRETYSVTYECEYHANEIQVHKDAFTPNDVVLIVDDVLATGGTAKAAAELVAMSGAKLAGMTFLMDLTFLKGMEKLEGIKVNSLIKY